MSTKSDNQSEGSIFHKTNQRARMEVMPILTILILNIILPTADVVTDVNLLVKLFKPQPGCVHVDEIYKAEVKRDLYFECSWDPVCGYYWWQSAMKERKYLDCYKDPLTFCSQNKQHCKIYKPHYKMATVLLMPCLLNYIICFYTFFRLTTSRKKYLFIFPFLNLYPQYGKTTVISFEK